MSSNSIFNINETNDSVTSSSDVDNSNVRLIRRYQNRKLYDTSRSSYVTLKAIAAMIREGYHIQIIDNKNQADITTLTLAQIVYENEKRCLRGTPVNVLHEVIRTEEGTLGGFLSRLNDFPGMPVVLERASEPRRNDVI